MNGEWNKHRIIWLVLSTPLVSTPLKHITVVSWDDYYGNIKMFQTTSQSLHNHDNNDDSN